MRLASPVADLDAAAHQDDGVEWCWRAVVARDRDCDGAFVYAVRTTGVYCLPSCGSRRANRSNVAFFATPAEAEAAGFRPCKRCRPNVPTAATGSAARIAAACRLIETAEHAPPLEALASAAGLSKHHFHRLFKRITGVTPKAYAKAHRHRSVRAGLSDRQSDGAPVTRAIYDAGYNSAGRFYAEAREVLGMSPQAFRRGGRDTVLKAATHPCSLGHVLVAATAQGVCAILLGDDPAELQANLASRFPHAEIGPADEEFGRLVARVVRIIDHPGEAIDLPLDVRGTAFQHRVWQALRGIAPGSTATYTEIAKRIGADRSVRAVAAACAANPVAVVVPCHRVVRADGSLSGYRWGSARKRALLDKEKKSAGKKGGT